MAGERDLVAFCGDVQGRLTGSLTLYLGDRLAAEELAQETLVRVVERWSTVSTMDAAEAWTYRVAFNLARSRFRRRAAERRAQARWAERGAAPASELPDVASALAVRAAVLALPERQRAVLVARFYADLSVAQTAAALGIAPGTVKAHTHRAVQALRARGLIAETDTDTDTEVDDAPTH